jgi:hypothetical protein
MVRYTRPLYDALRNHPATTGSFDGTTEPDEEMEDLFY